jgi:hypothetical protein
MKHRPQRHTTDSEWQHILRMAVDDASHTRIPLVNFRMDEPFNEAFRRIGVTRSTVGYAVFDKVTFGPYQSWRHVR